MHRRGEGTAHRSDWENEDGNHSDGDIGPNIHGKGAANNTDGEEPATAKAGGGEHLGNDGSDHLGYVWMLVTKGEVDVLETPKDLKMVKEK